MLSRFEIRKDMVQELTESAATHFGRIATIVSTAVGGVTHEVGDWMSDVFEMREAARRAEGEATQVEATTSGTRAEQDVDRSGNAGISPLTRVAEDEPEVDAELGAVTAPEATPPGSTAPDA